MFNYIGKSLVYFILVFSVGLMALAWGIASNNIRWAGTVSGPDKIPGLYDQNLEKIREKQDELARAFVRWEQQDQMLAKLEAKRPAEQAWYADQLAIVRTGKNTRGEKVGPPIQGLAYENDGRLRVDQNERPVLVKQPDARLADQITLDEELVRLDKDIRKEIEDIQELVKIQKAQTDELLGVAGKNKGLLAMVRDSLIDQQNALEELEMARQEAINGRVEVQALLQRQRQLVERVDELKKSLAAIVRP